MTSKGSNVALHNLASYTGQGIRGLTRFSIKLLLRCLSGASKASYNFFSGRYESYKNKIDDEASRTLYITDGQGKRRKIVCPSTGKDPRRRI